MARRLPPHLLARQRLLALIDRLQASGGDRLPGERQLGADLGVGVNTVKKALRHLALEGVIDTRPRGGHYLRPRSRVVDLGLIIGEGAGATFLPDPAILAAVLATIDRLGCTGRLLRLRDPAQAADLARQYRVDACLWYMPHPSRLAAVAAACRAAPVPMATTLVERLADDAERPPGLYAIDHRASGHARGQWLLARGRRRIAYCADGDGPAFAGFTAALAAQGLAVDSALVLPGIADLHARLPRLLDEGVDAIIADGGPDRQEALFALLDGHPWNGRGDLLIDHTGKALAELRHRFPLVRIAAINHGTLPELGVRAVEALAAAARGGAAPPGAGLVTRILPFDAGG